LGLGQAYAGMGKTRLASAAYSRAVQLEPGNADAWYRLGVSYLEQVEEDARILLTRHKDSAYVQALIAETFAEQRALIQADEAYKKVLTLAKSPPGVKARYSFVLLNRHQLPAAEHELTAELASNPGSLLAKLGMARLHLEQGASARAGVEIGEIWTIDPGFLRANATLFNTGLSQGKRAELERALEERRASGDVVNEMVTLFRDSGVSVPIAGGPDPGPARISNAPVGSPEKLYAGGRYAACSDNLASRVQQLPAEDLQLLAWCAYLTGNYANALKAATRLGSIPSTEIEGLYWETKTVQRLATEAFSRASATDPDSPKLHVLLGDIHRQSKNFPDAEQEYRKALALRPEDRGAQFGLSLALLAEGQNEQAMSLAHAALEKNSDDPELSAVMGEILCAQGDYAGAEPYLKKSLHTKPELLPRVHALLGKVYAQTDRTPQAIEELKLALPDDKDGRVHYQIARLYLKVGERDAARQAFELSDRLRKQGLTKAAVAMQQGQDNDGPQQ
jgi:tetratricopeptide (TPR) repeat protein